MEEIERIRKRLNQERNVVKENSLLKFFNIVFAFLLVGLGALIYCKQDEDGVLLKKIFNVDVSFKTFNESVENTLNNVFRINDVENNEQIVSYQDLYYSLGSNKYSTDDKVIRMLSNGKVSVSSYQNEYKYFVVIEYDNGVSALYTLIDEISFDNKEMKENDVIGSYVGDYFNCVFKKGEKVISYNEVFK